MRLARVALALRAGPARRAAGPLARTPSTSARQRFAGGQLRRDRRRRIDGPRRRRGDRARAEPVLAGARRPALSTSASPTRRSLHRATRPGAAASTPQTGAGLRRADAPALEAGPRQQPRPPRDRGGARRADAARARSAQRASGRRRPSSSRATRRRCRPLETALARETDAGVRSALMAGAGRDPPRQADAPEADRLAAVADPRGARRPGRAGAPALAAGRRAGSAAKPPPRRHRPRSSSRLALWAACRTSAYGISLGSVLLLAAIGLAITFGVMGVINMAHGEMVMLGAYTTFVVQEVIRTHAPGPLRLLAVHRPAARLPGRRRGRRRDRARHHPLPLRPAARDAARHLGLSPHPAAGGAHASSARPTARSARRAWMSGAFELGGLDAHLEPHRHRRSSRSRSSPRCSSSLRLTRASACRCAP